MKIRYSEYETVVHNIYRPMGFKKIDEENAALVASLLPTKFLEGILTDTIMMSQNSIGWCSWWLRACEAEYEQRIEKTLLG